MILFLGFVVRFPWAAWEGPIELLLAKVKNASGRIGMFYSKYRHAFTFYWFAGKICGTSISPSLKYTLDGNVGLVASTRVTH